MSEPDPASPAPTVRLYTQSMNPYAEKVAAALALKGIAFERIISDEPEDLQRWSPIARMLPVLEIDGPGLHCQPNQGTHSGKSDGGGADFARR